MGVSIDEQNIAMAQLEDIYKGTTCIVESVNKYGLITMTNGTQWVFDKEDKFVRMVAD